MKGIILAAGKGTRLYPASIHTSKTLLPIYDKPMIYYPLSTLMSAGITDIIIVISKEDKIYFRKLLGDGKQFGISIRYIIQKEQKGIADALLVTEKYIYGTSVALILGDNLFYGKSLYEQLVQAISNSDGATIFCKKVENPSSFGIAEFDSSGRIISIEEKPLVPKSNWAVTGLYFYDKNVCEYAKTLKPSQRGELEITDLNNIYLKEGKLKVQYIEEDVIWADTGTFDSLLETSNYVQEIEHNQRKIVGCPEEIALDMGFITKKQLFERISSFKKNEYYSYLESLLNKD